MKTNKRYTKIYIKSERTKNYPVHSIYNEGIPSEGIVLYAEKIRDILSRPQLHEEAVKSGFCRRDSKLKPEIFFELLFYWASRTENGSLSFMVSYLEDRFGIEMKKQSPDERFNEKCVDFVKAVLSEILRDKLREVYRPDFLSPFNRVRIKDSTKFVTPAAPAENYKGLGGAAGTSPAGICIQYEFDLKSGEIIVLDITPSSRNDQGDAVETADNMEEGDLIIRDPGYFATAVLAKTAEKKAYFLSRVTAGTNIYDNRGGKISLEEIYREMCKTKRSLLEIEVSVGERRVACRLILRLVPEEIYQRRLRAKEKGNKKSCLFIICL